MTYVAVGVIGFLIGLAAHDLGLQALHHDSALRPLRGVCARCGNERGWHRFRCHQCGRAVSREIFLAIITAATAVGFVNTLGLSWELVPYLLFLLLTSALVVTDLESFRLVDRLNLPGTLIVTLTLAGASLAGGSPGSLLRGMAGALAYFGGASLVFMAVRGRGFGAGDVKLAFQLGLLTAYLSWGTLGWSVFATAAIGGVVALVMVVFGSAGMKTELPYGPPMIIGAWAAIVLVGVGAIAVPT